MSTAVALPRPRTGTGRFRFVSVAFAAVVGALSPLRWVFALHAVVMAVLTIRLFNRKQR